MPPLAQPARRGRGALHGKRGQVLVGDPRPGTGLAPGSVQAVRRDGLTVVVDSDRGGHRTHHLRIKSPTGSDGSIAQPLGQEQLDGTHSGPQAPVTGACGNGTRTDSRTGQGEPFRLVPALETESYDPRDVIAAWVAFLAQWSWDWFATLTFALETHPEAAVKKFRLWIAEMNDMLFGKRWLKHGDGVNWVRAIEYQRRGVIHFHALLGSAGLSELRRVFWAKRWRDIAGFARIEPIRSGRHVRRYVAKYVTKGGEVDIGGPLKTPSRVLETPELGGGVLVG